MTRNILATIIIGLIGINLVIFGLKGARENETLQGENTALKQVIWELKEENARLKNPERKPYKLHLPLPKVTYQSPKSLLLRWDANKESNVVGYIVYAAWGTNFQPVRITKDPEAEITISESNDYTFMVTALDETGRESDMSRPVIYKLPK